MNLRLCQSLSLIIGLGTGCYSNDESLVGQSGNLQKKPIVQAATASVAAVASTQDATAKKLVASATYFLDIVTASGAKPCSGEINLNIMEDFTISLANSKAVCGNLTIDLEKLLGAQLQNGGGINLNNFSSDGQILSTSEIAGGTFAPPRPFIVGPLVQDVTKFIGLKRTTASTITVAKPDTGPALVAPGTFVTTVLEVNQAYTNKYLKQGFDKVMHWTLETQGFQGVPAKYGLLFKRWEWFWNTRPIMIPKIIITLEGLDAFIESKSGETLSEIVGEVTVTLTVKDYNLSGT